jgi:hypothetical protein
MEALWHGTKYSEAESWSLPHGSQGELMLILALSYATSHSR